MMKFIEITKEEAKEILKMSYSLNGADNIRVNLLRKLENFFPGLLTEYFLEVLQLSWGKDEE